MLGVSGFAPTGTVSYLFFTNATCSGSPAPQTVTLSGGLVPHSPSTANLGAGTYSYDATYSGDANYGPSPVSGCETFTVSLAPSSATTTVFDAASNAAWTGGEATGAAAYDTATVLGVSGFAPTGTVTYSSFSNGTCTDPPTSTQTVTLSGGLVPKFIIDRALAAGTYSYDATYSGDANYGPSPVSGCETFTVKKAAPTTTTTVFDAASNATWTGGEATGAAAYDTATVLGVSGFAPTGTVSYLFFTNATCSGSPAPQTVTLSGGLVPHSPSTANLGAGTYSYDATYSGDANYGPSPVSGCETFTVKKAAPTTSTTVFDAASNTGPGRAARRTGAAAYDTATVLGVSGFAPTGTVSYLFFTNATCSGSPAPQTVTLSGGLVPNSSSTGALAAGTYSYDATYSGDANYGPSPVSGCETFTVKKAAPTTSTTVFDAATNLPWSGSELTLSSAYDTSTMASNNGIHPTGSVTYYLYNNGTCTASATTSNTVDLSGGVVPRSSSTGQLLVGSYSFDVSYTGDFEFQLLAGGLERTAPLTVAQAQASAPSITNLPSGGTFGGGFRLREHRRQRHKVRHIEYFVRLHCE